MDLTFRLRNEKSHGMRLRLGFLLLLFSSLAVCQQGAGSDAAEKAVQTVMSRASDGVYTSWDEKQLDKLGDAAAVALTKVVGGKDLNPNEIKQALLILTLSFNAPRIIATEADKNPRAAFFVLKCLDHVVVDDPDLRKRVLETRVLLEHVNTEIGPP